jgi:hypothetical protein
MAWAVAVATRPPALETPAAEGVAIGVSALQPKAVGAASLVAARQCRPPVEATRHDLLVLPPTGERPTGKGQACVNMGRNGASNDICNLDGISGAGPQASNGAAAVAAREFAFIALPVP